MKMTCNHTGLHRTVYDWGNNSNIVELSKIEEVLERENYQRLNGAATVG